MESTFKSLSRSGSFSMTLINLLLKPSLGWMTYEVKRMAWALNSVRGWRRLGSRSSFGPGLDGRKAGRCWLVEATGNVRLSQELKQLNYWHNSPNLVSVRRPIGAALHQDFN
jgi:hypothetical protein